MANIQAKPGRELSLAAKVGQLFIVGFEGTEVTPALAAWLEQFAWGGVVLFGRNAKSPEQLLALLQGLQAVAQARGDLPLLIAIDQEGGRVARLKAPFTAFPSAAMLGRTGSEQLVHDVGHAIAMELRAVGITMNMAPVLDVLTNPANTVIGDRAFSADPTCVARLGTACIRGMHAAAVLTTAKHFPGHGDTVLDSHVARPVSERSAAQLAACELLPFREAIATDVDAIMTAHVVYPAWDPQSPATLSPTILTEVLRGELGFGGAIITDDLGMSAVSDGWPWEEIPLLALRAGADVLLICHERQRQEQAYARVLRAVQSGELPEAFVDRAVTRVVALKARLSRLLQREATATTLACIGSAAHQAIVELARQRSSQTAVTGGTYG
jgi:beta-N-acetylhexosaminidase